MIIEPRELEAGGKFALGWNPALLGCGWVDADVIVGVGRICCC